MLNIRSRDKMAMGGAIALSLSHAFFSTGCRKVQAPALVSPTNNIVRHIEPGSKYTLVHVDLIHSNPLKTLEEKAGDVSTQKPFTIQSEQMTLEAMKEFKVSEIAVDGRTPEDLKIHEKLLPYLRPLILDHQNTTWQKALLEKDSDFRSIVERFKLDYNLTADVRLAVDNQIKRFSLEDPEISALTRSDLTLYERTSDTREQTVILKRILGRSQQREDAILSNIVKQNRQCVVTLFGIAHDFTDNVKKWNVAHPQSKFSLIEYRLPGTPINRDELIEWKKQRDHNNLDFTR